MTLMKIHVIVSVLAADPSSVSAEVFAPPRPHGSPFAISIFFLLFIVIYKR